MPGYYDWKMRNCGLGASYKAQLLLQTLDQVEPDLHKIWDEGGCSFDAKMNAKLAHVVESIDRAEDALEEAKLDLAKLFPGAPQESP